VEGAKKKDDPSGDSIYKCPFSWPLLLRVYIQQGKVLTFEFFVEKLVPGGLSIVVTCMRLPA
jgi:hypothetical protein